MRLERRVVEGVTVVTLAESLEVDVGNADEFKDSALAVIGDDPLVVLDVARVDFFDSAGMAALLSLQRRVTQRNGTLVLAGLNRPVKEIFRMVGFDVIFQIFGEVSQAVAALRR